MTKLRNAQLLQLGLLGNHTRVWNTWDEWRDYIIGCKLAENVCAVGLRSRQPGGVFKANVPFYTIDGEAFDTHYVQECAPDEYRTIQGEAVRAAGGITFTWTDYPAAMRVALLQRCFCDEPNVGYWRVRQHMDESSWDNLQMLFDYWPDHVVEFTCFSRCVGVKQWNTIFWEVRNY